MSQLEVFSVWWCDAVPGLVVTGAVTGVVVVGGLVTGVVVSADDELDAAPLDATAVPVLVDGDGDGDALVVLVVAVVVAVVDVELVEVVLLTLAASNGSRLWLVGVVRCPDAA
jgi:hypothetical protein